MTTASQKRAQPRGIRNHNPGNIELGKDKWQGLAAVQDDGRFAKFKDPTWGIRALAIILINYQDKYNISTIAKIINRWAPKVENDTESYIREVCEDTGFTRNEKLDMHDYHDLRPVVEAIIRHENGRGPKSNINTWYDDATIKTGLQRAGVVQPVKTVDAVPVTKETVGATGTAVIGAAQIVDAAPQVIAAVESSQAHLESGSVVRLVIGIATIAVAVFIAYSQVKKHQEGVVA
jgi:hypothetical protein